MPLNWEIPKRFAHACGSTAPNGRRDAKRLRQSIKRPHRGRTACLDPDLLIDRYTSIHEAAGCRLFPRIPVQRRIQEPFKDKRPDTASKLCPTFRCPIYGMRSPSVTGAATCTMLAVCITLGVALGDQRNTFHSPDPTLSPCDRVATTSIHRGVPRLVRFTAKAERGAKTDVR